MSTLKRPLYLGGLLVCCLCFSMFAIYTGIRQTNFVFIGTSTHHRNMTFRIWPLHTSRKALFVASDDTTDAKASGLRPRVSNNVATQNSRANAEFSRTYRSNHGNGLSQWKESNPLPNHGTRTHDAALHVTRHAYNSASSTEAPWSIDHACASRHNRSKIEDILCMNRPNFTSEYRNPCWYERRGKGRVLRCLPYFHIIGVCKSGTTDLFRRLAHHPYIVGNRGQLGKETWFWTWKRYGHSIFYRKTMAPMKLSEFIDIYDTKALSAIRNHGDDGRDFHPIVTGHGDPMDFWDQTSWRQIPQNDVTKLVPDVTTPDLIKHVNPNVKLILLLRDPVERLFSNYLHGKFGINAASFHTDVQATLMALQSCTQTLSMRACLYSRDLHKLLKVPISASFYSVHLKEWLRVFPRKQLFVMRTEDFSSDIAGNLQNIFRFLRLENIPTADLYKISNMPHFYETAAKNKAGVIMDKTREALQEMFEPYNKELASLLNDDKYLWKRTMNPV